MMKLSGSQIVWLIVTTEIVSIIGINITPAILISKQDTWISMLVAGGIGAALTFLRSSEHAPPQSNIGPIQPSSAG